ncbi:uncharacterized protein EV154DRAFT_512694 [Mucor mucedo]|uniref:uncharacterized protein n=1 Tax=Mucor mucedo TaxID=29922 RepID=UPI00221F5CFB|nr:uncharacterized protein EV154DRAFT_512694 [Mucor mucedo]KAI7890024.1 hypothetical protein EV154DRAFT_512694 [Mucor mucedo]
MTLVVMLYHLWTAYLTAIERLSNEQSFTPDARRYLQNCTDYLQNKRPKTTFEVTYETCKQRHEDMMQEMSVTRAQHRVEREGELFGSELAHIGINKHRRRLRQENAAATMIGNSTVTTNTNTTDELSFVRYNKTYNLQSPQNNIQSPHKPKLHDDDLTLLKNHVAVRVSSSRPEQDNITEGIYQLHMKDCCS